MLPFLAPVSIFVALIGKFLLLGIDEGLTSTPAQIVSRTGHYRYFVIAGYALWSVAEGIQSTLDEHASIGKVAGIMLFTGFASAGTFQTYALTFVVSIIALMNVFRSVLAIQAAVPRTEMAVVTGTRNFIRLLGNVLGVAVCGALVQSALHTALDALNLPSAQTQLILSSPTAINDPTQVNLSAMQRQKVLDGYMRGFKSVFYLTTASMVVATLIAAATIEQRDLAKKDADEDQARMQTAQITPGPDAGTPEEKQDVEEKV
jgi:hypothetical protein